ncbi:MAG: hypothetical protein ACXAB4_10210 [Candidatus Hodarchaeales archaeon]
MQHIAEPGPILPNANDNNQSQSLVASLGQLTTILQRLKGISKRMGDLEDYVGHLETLNSRASDLIPLDVMALLDLPEDVHSVAMTLIQLGEATEDEVRARSGGSQSLVRGALKSLIRSRHAGCHKRGETISYFVAAVD